MGSRPRVLIVEDDHQRAEVILRTLEPAYETLRVSSLDAGLRAIGQGAWQAALADYNLDPRDSGIEFLQCVRELTPETFRVLYSVYYSRALVQDAHRIASVHWVLDARSDDFLKRIRHLLDLELQELALVENVMAGGVDESWVAHSDVSRLFADGLREAAESHRAVFLYGGPGTGKTFAGRLVRMWRAEWRARMEQAAGIAGEPGETNPPAILRVPSLEERRADVPALVDVALAGCTGPRDVSCWQLGPGVLQELLRRNWEGNVRQLRTILARACHRAGERGVIRIDDLPRDRTIIPASPSQQSKDDGQRQALLRQLRIAGSVARAAEIERVSRSNYIRLMRRLGIERVDVPTQVKLDGNE